jgi:hypothetical protein
MTTQRDCDIESVVEKLKAMTVHDIAGVTYGGVQIRGCFVAASEVAELIRELEASTKTQHTRAPGPTVPGA